MKEIKEVGEMEREKYYHFISRKYGDHSIRRCDPRDRIQIHVFDSCTFPTVIKNFRIYGPIDPPHITEC